MDVLGTNRGPYTFDYKVVEHKGKKINTILNSEYFDNVIQNIDTFYRYTNVKVPKGYEYRPDLISNVFYSNPKNWWLLFFINSIDNIFESFEIGQEFIIPVL